MSRRSSLSIEISEPDVVSYLEEIGDPEQRNVQAALLLRIGIQAIGATRGQLDAVLIQYNQS